MTRANPLLCVCYLPLSVAWGGPRRQNFHTYDPSNWYTLKKDKGRLEAYEVMGPTWQLNVINVHLTFRNATDTFLEHLMRAYRQLALIGATVIIGDFSAAP